MRPSSTTTTSFLDETRVLSAALDVRGSVNDRPRHLVPTESGWPCPPSSTVHWRQYVRVIDDRRSSAFTMPIRRPWADLPVGAPECDDGGTKERSSNDDDD